MIIMKDDGGVNGNNEKMLQGSKVTIMKENTKSYTRERKNDSNQVIIRVKRRENVNINLETYKQDENKDG